MRASPGALGWPLTVATPPRGRRITIYAVGFGTVSMATLEAISSSPAASHAYLGSNLQVRELSEIVCPAAPHVSTARSHCARSVTRLVRPVWTSAMLTGHPGALYE